jgi:hypothetical protein
MTGFTRAWPLAPAVIDYVAFRIGGDRVQACAALKDELSEGTIRARGPIAGADASGIASEFWRFAVLDPDGAAIDLSKAKKLAWVEFNAADVIAAWPPKAPVHAKGGRPPSADWPALQESLRREIESPDGGRTRTWVAGLRR